MQDVEVRFSVGRSSFWEDLSDTKNLVSISVWDSGWDDFGRKTECDVHIMGFDGKDFVVQAKVAFLGAEKSSNEHLISILKGRGYVESEVVGEYFVLIQSLEGYRKVVSELGKSDAARVFRKINDMAFARASGRKPRWFSRALASPAFYESLVRTSEAFFAYSNSDFLRDGLDGERLDSVSSELRLKFQLGEYSRPHEIAFSFDKSSFLPSSINILIGKNGVGKSRALSKIVSAARRGDLSSFSDGNGNRPMISRLLALATPGETASTFPANVGSKSNIQYKKLSLRSRDPSSGMPQLLLQLARSEAFVRGASRWDIFISAISSVVDCDSIAFKLKQVGGARSYRFSELNCASLSDFVSGNEVARLELLGRLDSLASPFRVTKRGLHPLSSGHLAFFRFALHACLFIENGTLVLMDEPETHLHPNLISDFVSLLNNLLDKTGSIAIISTHSAYFVREVPRMCVSVMRREESPAGVFVRSETPRLGTFGSNVGSISHFIFEDEQGMLLSRLIGQGISLSQLEAVKDEISIEAYIKIRDEIGVRR